MPLPHHVALMIFLKSIRSQVSLFAVCLIVADAKDDVVSLVYYLESKLDYIVCIIRFVLTMFTSPISGE